jgi:hypothetical protein
MTIDINAIKKQRQFEDVTVTARLPLSAAEPVKKLLERYRDDPETLAIVQELVITEGSKLVLSQLNGEKTGRRRGRKPKSKPDAE